MHTKKTLVKKTEQKHNPILHITIAGFIFISILLFVTYINKDKLQSDEVVEPTPTTTPHTNFTEIVRLDQSKKQVVVTVNAGFGESSAEGILSALKKHNYSTTFFLVGEWVEDHPELTRRIVSEGHEIFNHSYSHPDYTKITPLEIQEDLKKMDDVLFHTTSLRTRPYFRTPFGYRNEMVKKAAEDIGFQHVYWSIDSIDWRDGETGDSIKKRILDHLHPGAIILIHIGEVPTGEILDDLLSKIKDRGYELVSLTEALKNTAMTK